MDREEIGLDRDTSGSIVFAKTKVPRSEVKINDKVNMVFEI